MRIAIQGDRASFHDQAAKQWFDDSIEIIPADSFSGVFKHVAKSEADALVIAVENTLYGSINQVYDLIEKHGYPIIGEIHLPIHHQLIGTPSHNVTHIYSHPVALAQCETYLDRHFPNAQLIEYHDTATAVEYVKSTREPSAAAIASVAAAELHDMTILDNNIEDSPVNFTRFLVIQPDAISPPDANRSSLVIITDHAPGSLARILTIFASHGINLSKLQSRPIIGAPWKYQFYLVLDTAGETLDAAIEAIRPLTSSLKILGQYRHTLNSE